LDRRFIESVRFPFREVSEASGVEKGPGRPPYWEMVFWWTRKPLISARAVIAGCLLPEDTNPANFLRSIGIVVKRRKPDGRPVFEKSPHRVAPKLNFDGVKVLDPFACFGSIPLEGLKLGLSVSACDLLPVGYVFLKAVLEYPAKYGEKLVQDVKKWGEWVTEQLEKDPLIKELYDEEVAVYIGSWEVKCPRCSKWTPLIGNWWLARVKNKGAYVRLAWMEPRIVGDRVEINVIDLNKLLNSLEEVKVEGLLVRAGGKEFRVPEGNIEAKKGKAARLHYATCLLCRQSIMLIDTATGKHYTETKNLPDEVKQRLEGYVKFALKLYNEEVDGLVTLPKWLHEVPARLRLLVKVRVVGKRLEFEPCTETDLEKLIVARKETKRLLVQRDPDIPVEYVPRYETRRITPVLGATKWYQFFNPRQLLTLVKLTKLIREAGKLIELEKKKEGLGQEDVFSYSEAITTCLAITLLRYSSFTTLVSPVRADTIMGAIVAGALTFRGIAIVWNWCDLNPFADVTGSWARSLSNTINGLKYLIDIPKKNIENAKVFLSDATLLDKITENQHDLVVTDPPYYDDVPYAELSDFYYVWLKRALSDIKNGKLKTKFLREAFFEKIGDDWVEISTQWEKYALSEVSLNSPRLGPGATKEHGIKHFQKLLNSSFVTIASKLKNSGLLVTYYAHTSPEAWKALLQAGWEAAGLKVTNAFPITTESAQSVVSRGKLSMDTSILVVWRGFSEGTTEASDLYDKMTEEAAIRAKQLMDLGAVGRDLIVGTMAAALATATSYREVRFMGKLKVSDLIDKYVYPATYLGLAKALARKAKLEEGVKNPDAMYYLLVKSTLAGAKKKTLESTDARIFSIGTSLDLNLATKTWKILKGGGKEPGAKVAKRKTLTLIEPASTERSKLAELLEVKGIGIKEPDIRCTVDALHYMEYLAVAHPRGEFRKKLDEIKAKYPGYFQDALRLARILAKVLPNTDVEKGLSNRIIEYLEPTIPKLDKITK
jgi:putative DNA methylase